MVCLGNICRSPLAEGIMKDKLQKQGVPAFVDSAGLIDFHEGEQPDHRSIATARHHGIDITGQRARPFSVKDFGSFDYIFVMDSNNQRDVLAMANDSGDKLKVHMLLNYAGIGTNRSVPDPYYGDMSDFEKVFQLLDQACENITRHFLNSQAGIKISN